MCSELTQRARIPDTRIPQFMQPWDLYLSRTYIGGKMLWVSAGGSDWATHCVTCPASRSGDITRRNDQSPKRPCSILYHLVDLHTVQLLHSSGQLILVNALERSRFRLHLLLCGSTSTSTRYRLQHASSICKV